MPGLPNGVFLARQKRGMARKGKCWFHYKKPCPGRGPMRFRQTMIALCAALTAMAASNVRAEVSEITIAQQYGVSFLPLMEMEKLGLVEKHAAKLGLPGVTVKWAKVAGPSVMNDGLISGALHFASQGAPSLITLWSKTGGQIKGVAALTTYPLYLVTRDPDVKTIKDFTAKDKIAVPSVKISTQAIMLQMASAKAFGETEYGKLDPLTISLSHPDATLAFLGNTAGVNTHFSTSPFYETEIKVPDALDIDNKDKRAAAKLYLGVAHDTKTSVDDAVAMIGDKDYAFTLRPEKVFATAQFMAKIGSIKQAPASVDDLFFPGLAKCVF